MALDSGTVGKNTMNKLMAVEPVVYTENDELGELEVIQDDFLPSPQELMPRAKRDAKGKVMIPGTSTR